MNYDRARYKVVQCPLFLVEEQYDQLAYGPSTNYIHEPIR